MRAILRFALRSLRARRGRSALLAAAVGFATALVVAMACGIATAEANINARINRLIGAIDVRIVHQFAQSFDASLLEEVRRWSEVEAAGTRLFGSLTLARADGARGDDGRVLRTTVQARGVELDGDPRLNPLPLLSGRVPERSGELLVDPRTQKALRLELGDRVEVQRLGDPLELTLVGVYDRPALGALQRPLVHLDRATLAEATDRAEEVSAIVIILRDGIDVEAWCAENANRVREPLILEPAERVKTGLDRQAAGAAIGFTLVCMIGFLSCAFIVGTGLTTALADQVREMAMLRAIGAARRHLVVSQLASGILVAGAGAVVGVPLGIGVTGLGVLVWRSHLPAGLVVSPTGILVAIAGALASGVIGASFAAFAAARVTPLEALRIRASLPPPGALGRVTVIGVLLIAIQSALMLISDRDSRFWAYILVGIPAIHIAWFLLSVPVLRGVARVCSGALEGLLRLPRGLLAGAVESTPYRLGLTAGALMVGISILVSVWSNGLGLMQQVTERVRFADAFVFKSNGLTVAEQKVLRELPEVRSAVPVGYLPVRVIGQQVFGATGMGPSNVTCVGFEPEEFFRLNRIEWIEGDPVTALPKLKSGDAVLVAGEFLNARGYRVGDTITLGGPRRSHAFEIAGVVSSAGLDVVTQFFGIRSVYMEQAVSCVFMDFDAVAKWFDSRDAFIMQMDLGPDATAETELALGDRISDLVPGASFSSGRAIKEAVLSIGRTGLTISSGVAFSALLLASFGVGNVMAAGIAARKREFGVLRAVGGSRSTVVGVIVGEVTLIVIAAAISGTALGLQLAWIGGRFYFAMAGLDVPLVIPWIPTLAGYASLLILALVAALLALHPIVRRTPRSLLAAE